jgi:branched-subunit amino acid aminotransferase/4-amino-4-deoxychorismate lyase
VTAGVFETIRVRAGRAPLLERHALRLESSCRVLGVPVPDRPLRDLVAPWIGPEDAVVRVEVLGTDARVTTRSVPPMAPLTVAIATTPHSPYPHKVTARAAFEAAQAEARAAGADDALLLTALGVVAEGTVWSVFWWEAGQLATPSQALGVLPGVARARIMELTPTIERERGLGEVAGLSVFAANAVRGIIPIQRLGGESVPTDPRTNELAGRFWPA